MGPDVGALVLDERLVFEAWYHWVDPGLAVYGRARSTELVLTTHFVSVNCASVVPVVVLIRLTIGALGRDVDGVNTVRVGLGNKA